VNKKEKMQKDIYDSSKHKDNLQHENEEPVTFVKDDAN